MTSFPTPNRDCGGRRRTEPNVPDYIGGDPPGLDCVIRHGVIIDPAIGTLVAQLKGPPEHLLPALAAGRRGA
jgi:hypothetical protein